MNPPSSWETAKQARRTGLFAELAPASPFSPGGLEVRGPGAAEFLHGQLTNEVKGLRPGEGNLSARVTRKGQLVRLCSVHRLPAEDPPAFLILTDREGVVPLTEDLGRYLFDEQVRMEDRSDRYRWLAWQGPGAPSALQRTLGNSWDPKWLDLPSASVRLPQGAGIPAGTLLLSKSLTGDVGYLLALPAASPELPSFLDRARRAAHEHEAGLVCPAGAALEETLEILRIEAGIPRVGIDFVPGERLLPETGLEPQTVSYTKGCYLGQEVIARVRTYGSVQQLLRGLVLEDGELSVLPPPGSELALADGSKVGTGTSRCFSPLLESPIALAYLDRIHRTPGRKLACRTENGSFTATVALLPFYQAPDQKARVAALHDRAVRLFAKGKDAEAITLIEEALRLDPSFAQGYEALGVILGRQERFHEAIDLFKRLEEVTPTEPMVHTNLSLYYMKLGDKKSAEEHAAQAAVKGMRFIGQQRKAEQAAVQEAEQKRAEALRKEKMFREVLEIDPVDPIALFGLGNALSALERWEEAEKILAQGCEIQKDNSAIYLARGKALERLNRIEEALSVYRRGMEVASRKGDLMPLKEMEHRVLLLSPAQTVEK
jgi:folate-binding protein YgfZ